MLRKTARQYERRTTEGGPAAHGYDVAAVALRSVSKSLEERVLLGPRGRRMKVWRLLLIALFALIVAFAAGFAAGRIWASSAPIPSDPGPVLGGAP